MARVTRWQIDPVHTTVEFAVKHMMFTTVRGRFKTFSSTILIDEDHPDKSTAEAEFDAASVDTGAPDRDAHLRSADFLDVEHYPKVTFHTTQVTGAHAEEGDRFEILGDLTIRGKTIPVTLHSIFEGVGKDPWGNERVGFAARTEIDRREWGLVWNQGLETGGVLVGHAVKIEIEAQAIKQPSQEKPAA
jgi:polyisoprenoid-binding protein YceI